MNDVSGKLALAAVMALALLVWAAGCGILDSTSGDDGCVCTLEYAPVCGEDGETYGNACAAGCAGVDVDHVGACEEDCDCDDEYAPVCGEDGETYGNACEAGCAEAEVVSEGECS